MSTHRYAPKPAPMVDPLARAEKQTGYAFGTKFTDPRTGQLFYVDYETVRPGHYKMSGSNGTVNIEALIRIGELVLTSEYERITARLGKGFFTL